MTGVVRCEEVIQQAYSDAAKGLHNSDPYGVLEGFGKKKKPMGHPIGPVFELTKGQEHMSKKENGNGQVVCWYSIPIPIQ